MGSWRKGPWTPEEDKLLIQYVNQYSEGRWSSVSKCAGLKRNAKSCRLRWVNYLKPGLKKGNLTPQEEGIIIELHALFGNKWSTIARYLPGRTDNEIKNYWRTHFKRRKPSPKKCVEENIIMESPHTIEKEYSTSDEKNSEHDTKKIYNDPRIEEDGYLMPMVYSQESESWLDFIPDDSYLWGGLWNLDNQTHNIVNYSCEGDATSYAYNGGYML